MLEMELELHDVGKKTYASTSGSCFHLLVLFSLLSRYGTSSIVLRRTSTMLVTRTTVTITLDKIVKLGNVRRRYSHSSKHSAEAIRSGGSCTHTPEPPTPFHEQRSNTKNILVNNLREIDTHNTTYCTVYSMT